MFQRTDRFLSNTTLLLVAAVLGLGCNTMPTDMTPDSGVHQVSRAGIYVTNQDNSVSIYALDASGDAAPLRRMAGPSTGLSLPIGIARDTQSNLYVANRKGAGVTVYPIDADGDVAPTRTLSDPDMGAAEGIVIGPGDDVFVSTCPNCGSGGGGQTAVFHFANNATKSDFRIGGSSNNNTGFTVPDGLALDENRNLFVANAFGGNVSVFAPGIMGDQFPLRSFAPGGNTQSMAYANNAIFVGTPGSGINQFLATTVGSIPPSGNLKPDSLKYPGGIAVDSSVSPPVVYLLDYSGNAIFVIHTAGLAPFLTIDSVTTISGPSTKLSGPLGVLVVKS